MLDKLVLLLLLLDAVNAASTSDLLPGDKSSVQWYAVNTGAPNAVWQSMLRNDAAGLRSSCADVAAVATRTLPPQTTRVTSFRTRTHTITQYIDAAPFSSVQTSLPVKIFPSSIDFDASSTEQSSLPTSTSNLESSSSLASTESGTSQSSTQSLSTEYITRTIPGSTIYNTFQVTQAANPSVTTTHLTQANIVTAPPSPPLTQVQYVSETTYPSPVVVFQDNTIDVSGSPLPPIVDVITQYQAVQAVSTPTPVTQVNIVDHTQTLSPVSTFWQTQFSTTIDPAQTVLETLQNYTTLPQVPIATDYETTTQYTVSYSTLPGNVNLQLIPTTSTVLGSLSYSTVTPTATYQPDPVTITNLLYSYTTTFAQTNANFWFTLTTTLECRDDKSPSPQYPTGAVRNLWDGAPNSIFWTLLSLRLDLLDRGYSTLGNLVGGFKAKAKRAFVQDFKYLYMLDPQYIKNQCRAAFPRQTHTVPALTRTMTSYRTRFATATRTLTRSSSMLAKRTQVPALQKRDNVVTSYIDVSLPNQTIDVKQTFTQQPVTVTSLTQEASTIYPSASTTTIQQIINVQADQSTVTSVRDVTQTLPAVQQTVQSTLTLNSYVVLTLPTLTQYVESTSVVQTQLADPTNIVQQVVHSQLPTITSDVYAPQSTITPPPGPPVTFTSTKVLDFINIVQGPETDLTSYLVTYQTLPNISTKTARTVTYTSPAVTLTQYALSVSTITSTTYYSYPAWSLYWVCTTSGVSTPSLALVRTLDAGVFDPIVVETGTTTSSQTNAACQGLGALVCNNGDIP